MDYIKQLNAFDNWLEYNDLDITAQVMWYKLMSIANKSGWQVELSIANTKLMAKLEIDKKAVINCRNRLIQSGLIEYKSRGTKKAGLYKIRVLYRNKKETNGSTNTSISPSISTFKETNQRINQGTNEYPNTEPMTVPYINKTKQDKKKNKKSSSRKKFGEYQNVVLTDEELVKLKTEFPIDWEERIERLSGYLASTGKTYKSHLATIRNWARREQKNTPMQKTTPNQAVNTLDEIEAFL